MSFNPVLASEQIKDKYLRYLRTIFRIADADYAKQFAQALAKEHSFAAGPYLDITDSFKKGPSLDDLISMNKLSPGIRQLKIPHTRPLYKHQELAIEKACAGHNVVVSTGTGSGKTESFLIPIFDYLMRESQQNTLTPGVRALIIYPMNALANDQVERLRELLSNCPQITFGCYTGQTKYKYKNALAEYRMLNNQQEPKSNELISREQMREAPPHILITNYAMLEYLMIRPQDSVFFESKHADKWKFIVLDEAHVYNGSTGIEVSMLLRRLQAKLNNEHIQFILTSATLGDDDANSEVAEFARNLCNSSFTAADTIRADRIKPTPEAAVTTLPRSFYAKISDLLNKGQPENDILQTIQAQGIAGDAHCLDDALYQAVLHDAAYWEVRQHLQKPLTVSALAQRLKWSIEDVTNFVTVATRCEKNGARLFDARYHMFLRATESVFITLAPSRKLFLNRKNMHYETNGESFKVFEIATCSACHAIYLVGNEKNGYLEQYDRTDDITGKSLFLLADSISDTDSDHSLESQNITTEEYLLCTHCGHLRKANQIGGQYCVHGPDAYVKVHKTKASTASGILTKCVACENFNSRGILRQFFTGQEAVTSVIGTALFAELPSYKVQQRRIINTVNDTGFGRPINRLHVVQEPTAKQFIAFSDSRQAAAFYASYLDTTYRSLLYKRLIIEALRNMPADKQSINHFVEELIFQFDQHKIVTETNEQAHKEAWKAILDEVVNNNGTTSLAKLGLLGLSIDDSNIPPNKNYQLADAEVATMCSVFALGMMTDAAVQYPVNLNQAEKQFFTHNGVEYSYTLSDPNPKRYQRAFIPTANRTNKRLDYLRRVMAKKGHLLEREMEIRMLEAIWEGILLRENIVIAKEGQYRLNSDQIQITKPKQWYICTKCRQVTPHNVANVCPSYRCEGNLRPVDPQQHFEDNHYHYLYRTLDIRPLRVVEHTAQLNRETAYEYQKQFQQKQIDILSCSTTFEMGVDVGTLETVFMRNMPPSPANYAQRAGRAGRNKQSAAYAVTFCNKSSHDFTFFRQPEAMIRGRINPPKFVVENDKIAIRHLYATALGHFWSLYPQYFSKTSDMLERDASGKRGLEVLHDYLHSKPQDLRFYLQRFLPQSLCRKFAVENFGWLENLLGEKGALTRAVAEYDYELGVLLANKKRLFEEGKSGIDRLNARIRAYRDENILSFLSRKNVLPKYGFPVDTVEMQVDDYQGGGKLGVQLQRDLSMAISEYAPGSQVVANGKLFTSLYVRKIPQIGWKMFDYVYCDECETLNIQPNPSDTLLAECKRCHLPLSKEGTFLIPAQGFAADSNEKIETPGLRRPKRTYRGDIAYVGYQDDIVVQNLQIGNGQVDVGLSPSDKMAVLNTSHFFVCEECGYTELEEGFYAPPTKLQEKGHMNLSGYSCPNRILRRFALGYRFETDVILLHFLSPDLTDKEQALSVLYGLLRGVSTYLAIEENEIAGCLLYYANHNSGHPNYALVLFDRTPGGAGHVRRLNNPQVLEGALRTTLDLMEQCDCGGKQADSSCYACLRNYYNQRQHEQLKRGHVLAFLQKLFTPTFTK